MTPAESAELTDAERIEFLTHQLRYYKALSVTLNQELQATRNTPEKHGGRGLHRDPVGDKAARNVDNQRKRRK